MTRPGVQGVQGVQSSPTLGIPQKDQTREIEKETEWAKDAPSAPSAPRSGADHRIALELSEARRLLAVARRAALVDTDELDVVARLALLLLTAEARR